jgi:soluble lytic murein transglycosylase-like protein
MSGTIIQEALSLGKLYDSTPVVEPYKPKTIEQKIEYYAEKYNVSKYVMHTVINCESSYNPNAIGDGGKSRGLSQIHKPSHPNVTDEQAFDPDFAIDFMAKHMSQGNSWMWTCYRINFT